MFKMLTKKPQPQRVLRSQTICLPPVAGCLIKAEETLRAGSDWMTVNELQRRFLDEFYDVCRDHIPRIPEVESIASEKAADINRFLQERGFGIRVDEFKPLEFGLASVCKFLLEWLEPGQRAILLDQYPAVRIKKDLNFFRSQATSDPVVSICAKNGDIVRMTVLEDPPIGFDLVTLVQEINDLCHAVWEFDGAVFPMIEYDEQVDISWIQNMRVRASNDAPWEVSQALQQTKFRMNEFGAKFESGVAMKMRFSFCAADESKPDLIIDKPFLLWVNRPGIPRPLFIGHFAHENWKEPAAL